MALLLFTAAFALLGHRISELFWHARAAAPLSREERIVSSATVASALVLAVTWSLALAGQLKFAWLLVAAVAALILGLVLPRRSPPAEEVVPETNRVVRLTIIAAVFVPMAAWLAFLLWRGYVTPPLSHDALVYHMPRAAMFVKTATYQDFHLPDDRVDALPANYELLLADIMILAHGDTVTEWLSTIYFLLLVIATAGMAKRWWGGGIHVYVVALLVCSAPVLLLQAAAIKNDLLVAFFAVAAFLFCGRWLSSREIPSALLTIIACVEAAGTKPNAAIVVIFLAPLFVVGVVRAIRDRKFGMREAALVVAVSILSATLAGGYFYFRIVVHPHADAAQHATGAVVPNGYGEWNYLWQVPLVMWLAPFSTDPFSAPAPWTGGRTWWWPYWDLHDSNFGVMISILVLLLPYALWRWRRYPGRTEMHERTAIVIAVFLMFAVTLPRKLPIYGQVSGYTRYFLFLAPVVVCAVVPPFFLLVQAARRAIAMQAITIALSALVFLDTAAGVVFQDKFTPLNRAIWAAEHPGKRGVPLYPPRAATVLDALAGPTDSVDMYCSWDAWVYPAMGATLQRDLHFINDLSGIRPDSQWVVIDARRNWGNPKFKDIADWPRYMGNAGPQPVETAMINTLAKDPRFEWVYIDLHNVQGVFHRKTDQRALPKMRL